MNQALVKKTMSPPSANLFVGNLPSDTTRRLLLKCFQDHGVSVDDKKIKLGWRRGFFVGTALIRFPSIDAAKIALAALNGKEFLGRNLRIDFSNAEDRKKQDDAKRLSNPPANPPSNALFIKNLDYSVAASDLLEFIRSQGVKVRDGDVHVYATDGIPCGSARAEFHTVDEARHALGVLVNKVFLERALWIDYAEPRKFTPTHLREGAGWTRAGEANGPKFSGDDANKVTNELAQLWGA